MGTIKPVSSVTWMNSEGITRPRLGCPPPHQGLHFGNRAGIERHLGLIVDLEAVPLDRSPKVFLELETLEGLAPSFGAETLKRGEAYTRYAPGGLAQLPDDEIYRAMIDSGARIRFYVDYEEALTVAGLRSALETCAILTDATASGEGPLLLIGLFADDPYPTIARLSVEFAEREGRPPGRAELIEAYYGLPVPDLSLYVGFAQPEMFDVPLLTTGLEHLYATLNPSLDLTERQLREILYDHLVTRQAAPVDYDALTREAQLELAVYAERCKGNTLGIGCIDPLTGL